MTTIVIISSKSEEKIMSLDAKLNKLAGWETNDLQGYLKTLTITGSVEVGYRASCGVTDRSHKIYREWLKVVGILRKEGYEITEESVKHGNSYATIKGGFWNSNIYTLR